MRKLLTIFIVLMALPLSVTSQKKLTLSHYMHNQFAINPAFAGSREVLTLFGSYRKQWTSVPNAPQSMFFSAHAPLKNEKIALGMTLLNEEFAIAKNTGFSLAYTYRINVNHRQKLSFSINGGLISSRTSWSEVSLADPNDPAFGENETELDPQIGFGVAWYGREFFAGFSVSDLFYKNAIDPESPFFEPAKSDYMVTGGYLFQVNNWLSLQPSMLLRFNPDEYTLLDVSAAAIFQNTIWTGLTYRNNKEIVAMVGWQITPQLRFAYSFDYPSGDLGSLNNGNHEVSLQFDFGYKIPATSPKFF